MRRDPEVAGLARAVVREELRHHGDEGGEHGGRKYPSSRMSDEFTSIDDARERLGKVGYLADEPAALVSFLAGHARQARARGGPGGGRQDRARQGRLARDRAQPDQAPVLRGARRGQGAVRVELPQAAAAHPDRGGRHRLEGGQGRHLRRGVPARPPAPQRHHRRGAGGAPDRRDRQDRPGVRGDAPRGALRLPDLDPGAGRGRGAHAPARAAHLQQLARADRGAQAPLPLPLARLSGRGARARDRAPARARARPERWRASSSR